MRETKDILDKYSKQGDELDKMINPKFEPQKKLDFKEEVKIETKVEKVISNSFIESDFEIPDMPFG